MKMPKIMRCDSLLFQLGTHYKQVRKDRDGFILAERSDESLLYYEDIRPATN